MTTKSNNIIFEPKMEDIPVAPVAPASSSGQTALMYASFSRPS